MIMKYIVTRYEVTAFEYEVDAESEEQAIELARDGRDYISENPLGEIADEPDVECIDED